MLIIIAIILLLYLLYNKANNYGLLFYFNLVNFLAMYLFLITNQSFISIIIGLIYITAYSFLILLLILDRNFIVSSDIIYKYLFLLLLIILVILYSSINFYNFESNFLLISTYQNLYYSIIPNIIIFKLYIILFLAFFFCLVLIIKFLK